MKLKESLIATWETIEYYKKRWDISNGQWEDWFNYLIHQQGLTGFKTLIKNKNEQIKIYDKIDSKTGKTTNKILVNCRGAWELTKDSKIYEFLNQWKNEINNTIALYSAEKYKCPKEKPSELSPLEKPELTQPQNGKCC